MISSDAQVLTLRKVQAVLITRKVCQNQLNSLYGGGTDQSLGNIYQSKAGCLVVFVPDMESWVNLQAKNRQWLKISSRLTGLEDIDIKSAIDLMVNQF